MPLSDTVARAKQSMGDAPAVEVESFGPVNPERVLQLIGLNPRDPKAHAVIAVAERYHLDPVLGHIQILANSRTPYITRDGFLHIAHRSGHLDGIEIVDGPRREGAEWHARVAIYRDDMSHAFTYPGRAPVGQENGPEMAIARAERRALRRAFNVALPAEFGDEDGYARGGPVAALSGPQSDETPAPYGRTSAGEPMGVGSVLRGEDPANTRTIQDVPLPGDELPPAARMITRGQQVAMLASFRGLGINDRDARLRETRQIIGREVNTSTELTQDEASLVLDTLNDIIRSMDDDASAQTSERGNADDQS